MLLGRRFLFGGGHPGDEVLDRPISNYDIIGIPTRNWSSAFCGCFSNIIPSCVLAFFCPCVLWAQVVVRAQIPLLIGLKNSFGCLRSQTGYRVCIDYFFWSFAISLGLIICLVLFTMPASSLTIFLSIVIIVLLGAVLYLVGHTRTAFKEKYQLPTTLPPDCRLWDMLLDIVVMTFCMPCALSQMARHVFQYERMDTQLGLFLGDPSTLPPLRPTEAEIAVSAERGGNITGSERPRRADEAGLSWTHDGAHPDAPNNTGAAHRQQMLQQRQQQQLIAESVGNPAVATARATPSNNTIYNRDGSSAV